MQHETSKMKALIQDWRWIIGVSLLLTIPTYGFTAPMRYAVAAHILATLVYLGLLLLFGQGFVIEGAIFIVILATLFAMCSRPLHRFIHRQSVSMTMTWPNQSAAANRPQALRLTMTDNLNIDLASDAPFPAVAELGR
jgi:hypothetical protein